MYYIVLSFFCLITTPLKIIVYTFPQIKIFVKCNYDPTAILGIKAIEVKKYAYTLPKRNQNFKLPYQTNVNKNAEPRFPSLWMTWLEELKGLMNSTPLEKILYKHKNFSQLITLKINEPFPDSSQRLIKKKKKKSKRPKFLRNDYNTKWTCNGTPSVWQAQKGARKKKLMFTVYWTIAQKKILPNDHEIMGKKRNLTFMNLRP